MRPHHQKPIRSIPAAGVVLVTTLGVVAALATAPNLGAVPARVPLAVLAPSAGPGPAVGQRASGPDAAQAAPADLSLGTLEEHPTEYAGWRITVSGEVEELLGPHLFTIDEPSWIDEDHEALVFVRPPAFAAVTDDAQVRVTGRVVTFVQVRDEISRQWGWVPPDPGETIDTYRRPVVVASSVRGVDGLERVHEGTAGRGRVAPARPW